MRASPTNLRPSYGICKPCTGIDSFRAQLYAFRGGLLRLRGSCLTAAFILWGFAYSFRGGLGACCSIAGGMQDTFWHGEEYIVFVFRISWSCFFLESKRASL